MAAAIADVADARPRGRLEPDDVHGGTFTITNPGQFGAVLATPIINQPQVAILDLEAIVKRPVVVEATRATRSRSGRWPTCCMSWDHRALDGAEAARFLAAVKERLEGWEATDGRRGQARDLSRARARARGARRRSGASAAACTMAIAVHSTALGPALGGVRIWHYPTPDDGERDALRLAEGDDVRRPRRGSTSAAARE